MKRGILFSYLQIGPENPKQIQRMQVRFASVVNSCLELRWVELVTYIWECKWNILIINSKCQHIIISIYVVY